jgi:hypothetical protein
MADITISDWVLISTTVFLGAVALLTPVVGDSMKHWWLRPRLRIDYVPEPPGSHKTRLDVRLSPSQIEKRSTYYFRFSVTNCGRTQAHRCEAVLEELWFANPEGGLQRLRTFGSISLIWGAGYDDFVEINPSRSFYCDFITVPDEAAQATFNMFGQYIDLPPNAAPPCGLVLCTRAAFYSQPNRLSPGTYRLKVAVYSENADPVRVSFEVIWSGRWREEEELMMNECVIRAFSFA